LDMIKGSRIDIVTSPKDEHSDSWG